MNRLRMTWRGPVFEDTVPFTFQHKSVRAHQVACVVARPVVGFQAREMAFAYDCFDVLDVLVDEASQIHRAGRKLEAMPSMEAHRFFRFSSPFVVRANQPVKLIVRNVSNKASPFTATLFGVIVVPVSETKSSAELLSSPRSRRAGRGKTGGGSVRSVGTKTLGPSE